MCLNLVKIKKSLKIKYHSRDTYLRLYKTRRKRYTRSLSLYLINYLTWITFFKSAFKNVIITFIYSQFKS